MGTGDRSGARTMIRTKTTTNGPSRDDIVNATVEFVASGLGANYCADLNADSLLVGEILDLPALLRFVTFLEERFDFSLAPGDFRRENLATPGRIATYVRRVTSDRLEPVGTVSVQPVARGQSAA